jgi:hypothetical protein
MNSSFPIGRMIATSNRPADPSVGGAKALGLDRGPDQEYRGVDAVLQGHRLGRQPEGLEFSLDFRSIAGASGPAGCSHRGTRHVGVESLPEPLRDVVLPTPVDAETARPVLEAGGSEGGAERWSSTS